MRLFKLVGAVCLAALVAGCGGGGGSAGTPVLGSGNVASTVGGTATTVATTAAASVVVSTSSTTVSAAAPATITATVRNSAGVAQTGQVVTFSTTGGLGSFNVATALTDASGVASVKLSPASATANGADLVVAQVSLSGATVSGTIGFQVSAPTPPTVGTPSLALSLSSTTVTAAAPATVTATVKDAAGNPLAGQVVSFSSVQPLGTFNPSSALSDASGTVAVKLSPATTTTNGAALAVAQATVSGTQVLASLGFSVSSPGAPVSGTPSIALTLSSSLVTASTPATAVAVVKDGTGAAVAGQVVRFSTVGGLGVFTVSSALTDANGTAAVGLSAVGAGQSGADQVLASTSVNGTALQASQGFSLTAASASIASFSSDIATLGPYGQANLTVTVANSAPGAPVSLALSSACVTNGRATLTPATATTTTGTATFTYRDNGCGASNTTDPLQASIVGTSVVRALSVGLTAPTVSSITFSSASPAAIYLKSSGLTETSTLLFKVVDTAGNGLPNQNVTLSLLTAAGGLTLDGGTGPVTKLSDSLGNVSALINSGTVPTPVRVKASLNGGVTTVSSGLAVAVGLPSQLNFSLSQGTINIEGYDVDNIGNTYSILASDRLGNPVPAGTAINFITPYTGQIEAIKNTALVNGLAQASANFVSSGSRPIDGRFTVLAYALGEESFLDTNGNNIFDAGIDTQFQDLGSVFASRHFLQTYFSATDQLIPLAIPGGSNTAACAAVTTSLLALDKSIPSVPATCDGAWGRAYVRRATQTVLSTSVSRPLWVSAPAGLYANAGGSCARALDTTSTPGAPQNLIDGYAEGSGAEIRPTPYYRLGGATTLYGVASGSVITFMLADNNPVRLNPVAAGTTVSITAPTGLAAAVVGGSPVPSSASATFVSVSVTFTAPTTSGILTFNFTSPHGLVTSVNQAVTSSTTAPTDGSTICR